MPRGKRMKKKPPGQSTCSIVKICKSLGINKWVNGFIVYKRMWVPLTPDPPGPSARQGYPPDAASWPYKSDHLLQENFLLENVSMTYAMPCMSWSLSSHASHDIRQVVC